MKSPDAKATLEELKTPEAAEGRGSDVPVEIFTPEKKEEKGAREDESEEEVRRRLYLVGQTPPVAGKMSVIKEVDEEDKAFDEGKEGTA